MALSYTIDVGVGSANTNEDHLDYIATDAITTTEDYILSGSKGTVSLVSHVRGTKNVANWKVCTTVEFVLMCAPASYPELSGTQKKVVKSQKMTTRDSSGAGGSCTLADAASVLVGGNNLYVGLVGYDSTGNVVRTTNMQYACRVEQGALVSELTDGESFDLTAREVLQTAIDSKLDKTGYQTSDVGKLAMVNENGEMIARKINLVVEDDNLVIRGSTKQIIASIPVSYITEESGGGTEPVSVSNNWWSGYKYPDGRAVLKREIELQNVSRTQTDGVYITAKLFDTSKFPFPDVFIERPYVRATYIPNPNRKTHVDAYVTFQRGNSWNSVTSGVVTHYPYPPDMFVVCNTATSTTLLGNLYIVAEGRWK